MEQLHFWKMSCWWTSVFQKIILDPGKPVPVTWTTLESTAYAGNTTIVLREAVTWQAGDKVVIATTSDRHSQKETEFMVIQSVANDNRTITLTEPLKYEHLGVTETFDGTEVDFRAEVGMVSRNIVVRGDSNAEWVEKIEACPDGFDTGTWKLFMISDCVLRMKYGVLFFLIHPICMSKLFVHSSFSYPEELKFNGKWT